MFHANVRNMAIQDSETSQKTIILYKKYNKSRSTSKGLHEFLKKVITEGGQTGTEFLKDEKTFNNFY